MNTTHVLPKKLLKSITNIWDLFFNSLFNLFVKLQGNPKNHFIKISSQVMRQVKSSGKLNEHIIGQGGKKPMIEKKSYKKYARKDNC